MERLEKINQVLNQILLGIGGLFLSAMVVLTVANVFLRLVWKPVSGTFELMGYFGAVLTAFALGATQLRRGHTSVDILVLRFPPKVQQALQALSNILCMGFFILAGWQIAKYAGVLRQTGEVTETLRMIYYPFTYAVAFGCWTLAFVFFTDFLTTLFKRKENQQ